jgi:CheY-like chemotaxis protein
VGSRFTATLPAAHSPPPAAAPAPDDSRPLILVVDDDHAVCSYLSQLFEEHGYAVVTAADGQEALERARRYRPALITMDLAMPRLDGRTAIDRLREDPGLRSIPVIVISALPGRERAGADVALGKPVDERRLFEDVRTLLGAARPATSAAIQGHPCLFIQEDGEPIRVPDFCTSVARCRPEAVMERIQAGFAGMVIIPTALLGRVNIHALQQGASVHLVILPTGEDVWP